MQARARGYQRIEKVGLAIAGLAIPLFAISYLELRGIDDAVMSGGERTAPYLAYLAILMFIAGFATFKVTRHLVADISRALEAEQARRIMKDEGAQAESR